MARTLTAALFCFMLTATAFAQTSTATPDNSAGSNMNPATMPGMAGTSSDPGQSGTGASSAAIGTGNTETHGVMSPTVPATGGHGETGANPNNPNGSSNSQQ